MSDRALRRLVADLASSDPQDVDEVLSALDAPEAARVRALLADYVGVAVAPGVRQAPPPLADLGPSLEGLSDWLTLRLVEGGSHRMTAQAQAALNDSVRAVQPAARPPVEDPQPPSAQGWRERVAAFTSGLRR